MVQLDLSTEQCRQLAELLKNIVMEDEIDFDTLEGYVMMRQSLLAAKVSIEEVGPKPKREAQKNGLSPAKEAAIFKRQTVERLGAYVHHRVGATGAVASKAGLPSDTVARMLMREKFSIDVWRQVAAALDELEGKNAESGN